MSKHLTVWTAINCGKFFNIWEYQTTRPASWEICMQFRKQQLFFSFYFNWRLITLQYCSGFCYTLTWISHGCTCVPHLEPPSHLPPSGPSQCTSPEHPVSCIETGLAICFTYDKIYVSMLFSQMTHPRFSHRVYTTESKRLFVLYICASFTVSHIGSLLKSF